MFEIEIEMRRIYNSVTGSLKSIRYIIVNEEKSFAMYLDDVTVLNILKLI